MTTDVYMVKLVGADRGLAHNYHINAISYDDGVNTLCGSYSMTTVTQMIATIQ